MPPRSGLPLLPFLLVSSVLPAAEPRFAPGAQPAELRLILQAGEHDRAPAPAMFTVPAEFAPETPLALVSSRDPSQALPVQWIDQRTRTAAFVSPALAAGQEATFRLAAAPPRSSVPAVECRVRGGAIELSLRGKPVLRYNTAVVEPPPGIEKLYRRSGHIHPVYTPAGRIVTAEFPADHAHQHGIFFAWVSTTFEGRKVDFWNQRGQTGDIEHVRTVGTTSGDVFGGFTVELRHSDLTAPGGAKPVLKEIWSVRVWNVADGHLFDLESRQTCIATAPLILNKYHYGGMAFRGTDAWFAGDKDVAVAPPRKTDFEFLTSDGKTRVAGNHTRPRWLVAHGAIDGSPASVIAMGHPDNFGHPEPVRLHPTKPYFVFTPPFLGEIRMEPGVEHVAHYRFFVRDAAADVRTADRVWRDLSQPIRVTVAPGKG